MGIFDGNMPYTNLHELNLDWVIKKLEEIKQKTDDIDSAVETTTENAENAQTASELAGQYLEQFREDKAGLEQAIVELQNNTELTSEQINEIITRLGLAETNITDLDSRVDVNSERITNLATLTDGSTTGDAELIDGRIGYNGTTYSNIGDAIRGQAQELYNMAFIGSNRNFSTTPTAPYDDCNTIPMNTAVSYVGSANRPANYPPQLTGGSIMIMSISRSNDHLFRSLSVQICFAIGSSGNVNHIYYRGTYGSASNPVWGTWNEIANGDADTPIIGNHTLINSVEELIAPFDDLNTLAVNTVTSYSGVMPENSPVNSGSFTVLTFGRGGNNDRSLTSLTMQMLIVKSNYDFTPQLWIRGTYGLTPVYGAWFKVALSNEIENATNPTMTPSLFNNLAVIGDSFATGRSNYNLSWLQMICRQYGCSGVNYSSSNLTTRTWLTDADGLTKLQNDSFVANLYFVALGINDSNPDERHVDLGTISDMDLETPPDTYYGNMKKIYDAIKTKNSNAAICFITPQRIGDRYTPYANACINIANKLGCLYIDSRNSNLITSSWWSSNLVNAHPTPPMYNALSNDIVKLLSLAIYNSPSYLADMPTVN